MSVADTGHLALGSLGRGLCTPRRLALGEGVLGGSLCGNRRVECPQFGFGLILRQAGRELGSHAGAAGDTPGSAGHSTPRSQACTAGAVCS